jgi:hypothetical protein
MNLFLFLLASFFLQERAMPSYCRQNVVSFLCLCLISAGLMASGSAQADCTDGTVSVTVVLEDSSNDGNEGYGYLDDGVTTKKCIIDPSPNNFGKIWEKACCLTPGNTDHLFYFDQSSETRWWGDYFDELTYTIKYTDSGEVIVTERPNIAIIRKTLTVSTPG